VRAAEREIDIGMKVAVLLQLGVAQVVAANPAQRLSLGEETWPKRFQATAGPNERKTEPGA